MGKGKDTKRMDLSAVTALCFKIKQITSRLLVLVMLCAFTPLVHAANPLLDVKYHSVFEHQLEMEFIFKEDIAVPNVDTQADPARIVLHFADSQSDMKQASFKVNKAGVSDVVASQQTTTLNVAVNLDRVRPFQSRVIGNRYRLTINDTLPQHENRLPIDYINHLKNIDFKTLSNWW